MSQDTQLTLALTFTFVIAGGSFAFFAWLLWSLFWDVFDYMMEQHKRIENDYADELKRANGFHIPACFRDQKGVQR